MKVLQPNSITTDTIDWERTVKYYEFFVST
jgi:hypothetical protein